MINPIQQNVVFKGVKNSADNFTGAPAVAPRSVRQDYLNAVQNVSDVQSKMKTEVTGTLGQNLNVIA